MLTALRHDVRSVCSTHRWRRDDELTETIRFAQVGISAFGSFFLHGCEVEITECVPHGDGRFHLSIVGMEFSLPLQSRAPR